MKTLLVKPYSKSDHIQPSLGLGYLAASIRRDYDVRIVDCIKEDIRPSAFYKVLDRERPNIVGLQCYTYDAYNIKDMLKACKERGITTVVGGPHPSAVPEETVEFFGADLDYAFRGESEIGFKLLLDRLSGRGSADFKDIPGLIRREGGRITVNEKKIVENIDSIGMPAWDLIRPQEYPEAQHGAFFKNFPIAPIITTRGCPFSCTFCAGSLISGKRLRKRSVESILDEIKTLYNDYGIREFHIIDDNFTLDKKFATEFLTRLRDLNMDISWAVPNGVRVDTLDDELINLMKASGLYLVSLGIESGSDRVLKLMKKNLSVEKVRRAVEMIRRHDIEIAGFFILGFPGETIEEINRTIDFSLELDLIRANFFTYLPFPGTESCNELKQQGRLEGLDTQRFSFMNASFTPEGISKAALKRLQRKAFARFFLRPKILLHNLLQIKSVSHFKFLFKRFANWMLLK